MIKYEDVQLTQKIPTSITCDRCNKTYGEDDVLETQEFHRIHFTGGYASVFGDETQVDCDLCQHCLKELIGKYCFYDGTKEDE